MKYRFDQIAYNSTAKKKPTEEDRLHYIGLEHMDSNCPYISRWGSEVTPTGEKLIMKKGDILFGKRRAYQRKVAIAPFDGIFSAHGMVLRPNEEVVDKDFFPLFLSSDDFMERAVRISVGGLSPTINWKDLRIQEFELPPIDEQRRIAEKAWAAWRLKQSYQRLISATQEMVKSQFIEMFGDPITNSMGFPTMTLKEASLLLSDGPFGSNLKSDHYRDSGVRVIRLQNICRGYFDDTDKAFVSEDHANTLERYTCRSGEIVIGTLGEPNLRACLVPNHITKAINKADCVHYIPKPELLDNTYVCHYLNSERTLQIATSDIHGTTRARIAAGQLAKLPILLPPLSLQREFVAIAEQADKSQFELRKAIEAVDAVIKSLINNH